MLYHQCCAFEYDIIFNKLARLVFHEDSESVVFPPANAICLYDLTESCRQKCPLKGVRCVRCVSRTKPNIITTANYGFEQSGQRLAMGLYWVHSLDVNKHDIAERCQ